MIARISVLRLLREPTAFDGETVVLLVLADFSGASPTFRPSSTDRRAIAADSLPAGVDRVALDGKYVIVQGTFHVGKGLSGLTRCQLWSDPDSVRPPPGTQPIGTPAEQEETLTSVGELVANPEPFHGKRVTLLGFSGSEFERSALYVSEEACRNNIEKDALWVSREPAAALHERYVRIEATFDMNDLGHGSMYSGALIRPRIVSPADP